MVFGKELIKAFYWDEKIFLNLETLKVFPPEISRDKLMQAVEEGFLSFTTIRGEHAALYRFTDKAFRKYRYTRKG